MSRELLRQAQFLPALQAGHTLSDENWFLSLEDAREKVEEWRQHYNREKPHGSLGNVPPVEFVGVKVAK
jgi:transposase InsO family protein